MNISGMLPFENKVDDYIEETGNHVMYRVTPVFEDDNAVAGGVLMEAWSVEDNGAGISFCVYCYTVQPQIFIDYSTGENYPVTDMPDISVTDKQTGGNFAKVYITPTGKRYHTDPECCGENSYVANDISDLSPCKVCVGKILTT